MKNIGRLIAILAVCLNITDSSASEIKQRMQKKIHRHSSDCCKHHKSKTCCQEVLETVKEIDQTTKADLALDGQIFETVRQDLEIDQQLLETLDTQIYTISGDHTYASPYD